MLHFSKEKIQELLPMSACIQVMRELFHLNHDELVNPPRMQMELTANNRSLIMPAYIKPFNVFGVKVINLFPKNGDHNLSTHIGIMQLFETNTGQLLATFNADELTAIRTAAVSAVATDLLANQDAEHLCILGTGTQASSHLKAISCVRPIKKVSVWGRTSHRLAQFVQEQGDLYPNIEITACNTVAEASKEADIICTLTAAAQPILQSVKKGCHINAIGSSTPNKREISSKIVQQARIFVDNMEATFEESGDILIPLKENIIKKTDLLGSLNDLVSKTIEGRSDANQVTLFSSVGLAIEDVASAHYIYHKNVN